MFASSKKAFTLIELLVVIAIIALLSTLSVVALNNARAKARDSRRLSDIKQLSTALEMYLNETGVYPDSLPVGTPITDLCLSDLGISSTCGTIVYLSKIPSDPKGDSYQYYQIDNGNSYTLDFVIEVEAAGYSSGNYQATPSGIVAGGGGYYVVQQFTDVGSHTWTVPAGVTSVEVLVVAGGGSGGVGSGGNAGGGGGGGGGVIQSTKTVTPGQSITITVGAGGLGISSTANTNTSGGIQGQNSVFDDLVAIGGGRGASAYGSATTQASLSGGSGGGAAGGSSTIINQNGLGVVNQGFAGGINTAGDFGGGGGGGGASQAGLNGLGSTSASSSNMPGKGGDGLASDITGILQYYGGGGGGGHASVGVAGYYAEGGLGGGGRGDDVGNANGLDGATDGLPNTGGGGGGGGTRRTGQINQSGAGGSGIVIIKFIGAANP